MVTIKIDDTLRSMGERIADKRHDTFSHDSYEETAMGGKSSYEVHLLGALTELAVSDYFKLLVDMKVHDEGDKSDFEIRYRDEPATLDVKSTTYRGSDAWLLVNEWKVNSDYFLLATLPSIDSEYVELNGWASAEQVKNGDLIQSPGGADYRTYRLWKDELEPVPDPSVVESSGETAEAIFYE